MADEFPALRASDSESDDDSGNVSGGAEPNPENMEVDPPSPKKKKRTAKVTHRRQTVDTLDLRQLVLRNNVNNDIRSKLVQSLNMNKNQIVIDYNVLAFMENTEVESDEEMEVRMKRFIETLRRDYIGIQYMEYRSDNKLYCVMDIVYFLPVLFNRAEHRELAKLNRKSLDEILERLDNLSSIKKPEAPTEEVTEDGDRNIRLYSIGSDFYLMCRKKQNVIDGQKNLEKKFGKCRLLKTWNNRTNVKDIGKLILQKFPHLKWNARTNIITNSRLKEVSENDLLNYLVKNIK